MKKTFIAFLLAALMIVPMASAVSPETYDADLDSSATTAVDDEDSARAVARVEPTGLELYAMYVNPNGQTVPYKQHYLYFAPENGLGYIRYEVGPTLMNKFKAKLSENGITPVGWYVETAYDVQAYRAVRWEYYEWTAAGKSTLKQITASLGNNPFKVKSDIVDGKNYYKLGISGDLIYYPTSSKQATIPIELSIIFARIDPGIQLGVLV